MRLSKITKIIDESTGKGTFIFESSFEGDTYLKDRVLSQGPGESVNVTLELHTFSVFEKGGYLEYNNKYYKVERREPHEDLINIYLCSEVIE